MSDFNDGYSPGVVPRRNLSAQEESEMWTKQRKGGDTLNDRNLTEYMRKKLALDQAILAALWLVIILEFIILFGPNP